MDIRYSVSLWNFYHYSPRPDLGEIATRLHSEGYGLEMWNEWKGTSQFDRENRDMVRKALGDTEVTLHTRGPKDIAGHLDQIDAAVALGAPLIVIHEEDVTTPVGRPDHALLTEILIHAGERGIHLALENDANPKALGFLGAALDEHPTLGFTLDVGHVYFTDNTMSEYLEAIGGRITHLHIQDTLPMDERVVRDVWKDHFIPGTGGIPEDDWHLLVDTLRSNNYSGTAVFEVAPRSPWQTAFLTRRYMDGLLE